MDFSGQERKQGDLPGGCCGLTSGNPSVLARDGRRQTAGGTRRGQVSSLMPHASASDTRHSGLVSLHCGPDLCVAATSTACTHQRPVAPLPDVMFSDIALDPLGEGTKSPLTATTGGDSVIFLFFIQHVSIDANKCLHAGIVVGVRIWL